MTEKEVVTQIGLIKKSGDFPVKGEGGITHSEVKEGSI